MRYDATNKPILVIGYGNILRCDDGVGWAAARRLTDQLPSDLASVLTAPQLLPELAETVSHAERVIFIDADAQLPAGEVRKLSLQPGPMSGRTIGHHQTPEGMLRLAEELYGHAPHAELYSIGGADFSFGCTLSPAVQVALRKVVLEIVDEVIHFSQDRGCCHA
jgi:hydrogenase maturation protease